MDRINTIKTLSDTILWVSRKIMEKENISLASAVHAINMEVTLKLCKDIIKEHKA